MQRLNKKQLSYHKGLWAEDLACMYLRLKGYRIRAKRFKTPLGEIDIVATKPGLLAIIEVKERKTIDEALQCVSEKSKQRIRRASEYYRTGHPWHENDTIRFDLIAVHMPFLIRHLQNAW